MNNSSYFMNSNKDEHETISTFFMENALLNMVEVIISREDYNRYAGIQHYQDYINLLYKNVNMIIKEYGNELLSLMIFAPYGVALESAINILKITRAEKYTVNFYAQANLYFYHQFYFDNNPTTTDEIVLDITKDDGTFDSYKSSEILRNRTMPNYGPSYVQTAIRVYDPMKKILNFDIKFGAVVKVLIKDLEEYSELYLLNIRKFKDLSSYDLTITTKTDAGKFRLLTCYDSTIWLFDGSTQRLMRFNDCRKTNTDKPFIASKGIKLPSIFVGSSYKEVIDNLKKDERIAMYIGKVSEYTDPEFGQGYLIKIENVEIAGFAITTSIANLISQKFHQKPIIGAGSYLDISQIENGRLKVNEEMYIDLYTEVYNVE